MNRSIHHIVERLLFDEPKFKNVACLTIGAVVSLLTVIIRSEWIGELKEIHLSVAIFALLLLGLLAWGTTWLLWSVVVAAFDRRHASDMKRASENAREDEIARTLHGLTPWQDEFLRRMRSEKRTQIQKYEIGSYEIVWSDQINVLVEKQILRQVPNTDTYELIEPFRSYILCSPSVH